MKYHKVKWDQVPEIDELQSKRNKFNTFHMNKWFMLRPDHIKPQYLYYPEERRLQMELKQIFLTLDCNNQGVLTLSHMFLLFKHFGYQVSSNDLQTIYSYIDHNKDNALSMDEFKGFTENPQALQAFRNMMAKMQSTLDNDRYIPLSVGAMLSHISYLLQRERHLRVILSQDSIQDKFQAFRSLIQDTEKKTIADEAYIMFLKAQVEFHKKIKRQGTLDQSHKQSIVRKSYSTVFGLQPLIFRNMIMRDANELESLANMMRMQSKIRIESFDSVSEEDENSLSHRESNELQQVIEKAQKEGKKQALKEIQQIKQMTHKKQLSVTVEDLPPLQFNLRKCHSTKNKSMLERQLKLQKLIPYEEISQFNFLSTRSNNKNYSSLLTQEQTTNSKEVENQGSWSNRILSMKLPTLS